MNILFVHPNFPGQFRHLAASLGSDAGNRVLFLCRYQNGPGIAGVRRLVYQVSSEPAAGTHRYLLDLARGVYAGQAVWRMCDRLKRQGFSPDVIYAHPGWGEALFLKDIYPDRPLLSYLEFYYHAFGADVHFDPDEAVDPDRVARIRIRNAKHLLNLEACDWAVSPTRWQAQQHPAEFRHRITVLHDGIDTRQARPGRGRALHLPDGTVLDDDTEIITYVARNFEPYRGFPQVMRALELILHARPAAHVLMVGGDGISYGPARPDGRTWKEVMLEEVDLPAGRVHWLGRLPYRQYLTVLRYSRAHIYLTVPFVLSWSLLEAMASACPVVASATAPVQEVVEHGRDALLVDFFRHRDLADAVVGLLKDRAAAEQLGRRARETILAGYDLRDLLPRQQALLMALAAGGKPTADSPAAGR